MTKEEIKLIKCAKTIMEYCKDHTNSCGDCPFYRKNNGEWTSCMFEGDIPEGWGLEDEQNRH